MILHTKDGKVMSNMGISKKIVVTLLVSSLLFIVVGFFISSYFINNIEQDVYKKTKDKIVNLIDGKESAKSQIGLTNVLSIANNKDLANAVATGDKAIALEILNGVGAKFKANTRFKNIKVHVHTTDNKSFLRAWNPKKNGDDLSSFRATVVEVNSTKKAFAAVETGRAGLVVRGLTPLFDAEGNHIGSMEFIQGFNSIVKALKKSQDLELLVLMDDKLTNIATKANKNNSVENYIASQKTINKEFLKQARTIDFKKLKKDGYYKDSKYFYTYKDIKNFKGEKQGMYLVGEKIETVEDVVANAEKIIYSFITLIVVLIVAMMIIVMISMSKYILTPLKSLQDGLESFFDYINRTTSQVKEIDIKSGDEIGQMMRQINDNINKTKNQYQRDVELIAEVSDVIEKVENGFYTYTVKGSTTNPEIETLKNSLNVMIASTNDKLNRVSKALQEYGLSKFNHNMDMHGMNGNFGSVAASTKLLGNNVSELLAMILNTGDRLNASTGTLSDSASSLSTSANQQAASLEETAAALEEISSNIRHTVEQSQEMAIIAKDTKESATQGKDLAVETARAMDEINSSTTAINEAITVIDQIAFQTNILSLNAAVEAATAGEVRNLAGRSAEAAKEIKTLVEQAQTKTNEGKSISEDMMNGFESLNDKISKTSSLVEDVAHASKEQLTGVTQINDALTQLDQETQENARVANEISILADDVSHMADNLVKAASRAEFRQEARTQVCDIDLVFDTAKLKLDHVALKENNFMKLDSRETTKIVDHHGCNLGRWIDSHSTADFAKTKVWSDFQKVHAHVHQGIQEYMDASAGRASNSELKKIAENIERDTVQAFDYLNEIKREHCRNMKIETPDTKKHDVVLSRNATQAAKVESTTCCSTPAPKVAAQPQKNFNEEKWDTF
jgi:methyl-accepting chemotaxis protein